MSAPFSPILDDSPTTNCQFSCSEARGASSAPVQISTLGQRMPRECHICCKPGLPPGTLQRASHGSMVFGLYYETKSSTDWRPLCVAEGAAYRATHFQVEHKEYCRVHHMDATHLQSWRSDLSK